MFSWLKQKNPSADPKLGTALYQSVRAALGPGDDVHVRIVGSVAALYLCVAYADCDYGPEEESVLRATLSRIRGLDGFGVEAISKTLREHTVHIVAAEATTYARELLELTDEDFRLEVLDGLVDLAAADGKITVTETNVMRSIARALGLPPHAYNTSQARHRDKLAVLG